MSLKEYARKRRFFGNEPTPEPKRPGRKHKQPIFVVQLHHARNRHYDFRLEHNGRLKSWAIPKGPSLDSSVKRLAVQVEDHPISYAGFEGDIPQGHYGAGHVDVFDLGTWSSDDNVDKQLKKGHLRFQLKGTLLRGAWHLLRTQRKVRQPHWLLIKIDDAEARPLSADDMLDSKHESPALPTPRYVKTKDAVHTTPRKKNVGVRVPMPVGAFAPALCKPLTVTPTGTHWLHEVKWDGYRLLATVSNNKVHLWSRNAIEWTERLPHIAKALQKLKLKSAQFDGELIALDGDRSDFNLLKGHLAGDNQAPLVYELFDMPYLNGYSLAGLPLLERKERLAQLLERHPHDVLRYSAHIIGNGASVFKQAQENGLEGVVSKRIDSPYCAGRVGDWVKTKGRASDEFVVIGYTAPKGSRTALGSLLLARGNGAQLRYAGRCGTGFDDKLLRQVKKYLQTLIVPTPSVETNGLEPRVLATVKWVKPKMIVEVYYMGLGSHELLRHPVFKAIREDKSVADIVASKQLISRRKGVTSRRRKAQVNIDEHEPATNVKITHADRIVFPDIGISKAEVADYYRKIMPWLLPAIVDRPLAVVRCPDGVGQQTFFQKHLGKGWGPHIHGAPAKKGKDAEAYLYISDAAGVLELVQMNVIEFHPWGTTVANSDHADRVVLDLDPHVSVSWKRVSDAAVEIREFLDSIGLRSFLRTTGGKGLHVVVPLAPAAPWDQAKNFSHSVALMMAQIKPEEFIADAAKVKRKGRIFIDWLRNERGATSVASYSLRARPGAKVAVPLSWEELPKLKSANSFNLHSLQRRLVRIKNDPWRDIASLKQSLDQVRDRLAKT